MMPILMLIMMFKFCVKESGKLVGLENFGAAGFSLQPGWISAPSISQKILPDLSPFPHPIFTLLLLEVGD